MDLTNTSPSQLWASLDPATRVEAARALYAHDWGEAPTRREADATIMHGMRFRETAVRQLPVEKRAQYLARSVRPSDSLSSSLLLAFHLAHRREILGAFLDALKVPHKEGLIDEKHEMKAPADAALSKAIAAIEKSFPREQVDLYLATLYVLDRDTWGGLERRFTSQPA